MACSMRSLTGSFFLAALLDVATANIVTLDELNQAIQTGSNKKVAFLTKANYDSVHTVLHSSAVPVVCDGSIKTGVGAGCDSTDKMIALITSGDVLGGLISGLPASKHAGTLNTFSSTVVSTRAMLMNPAHSADTPHGSTDAAKSSFDLSKAVDAAVVKMQTEGKDEEIRLKNMPFEFMAVHTCKGSDLSAFMVPDKSKATGLLKDVLANKVLKVGSLGPYDWGGNDGNYKVTPHVGFYPDYYTEFCRQFNMLKGPDGVAYNSAGTIKCERVWQLGSGGVFADLFDGKSHVTEPYYIVDSFYTGTGEDCSASACRNAVTATGKETCSAAKKCTHSKSPRTRHFRFSCSTIGVDSTFMTKRIAAQAASSNKDDGGDTAKTIAIAVAIACGVGVICLCAFVCIIVQKEKKGQPMFMKLTGSGGGPGNTIGASC